MSAAPQGIPRAAWVAVGAAGAAASAWLGLPVVVALVAGLLLAAAGLAARSGHGPPRRAVVALPGLAAGVGASSIALRIIVGPAAPPVAALPEGGGPWRAEVESVGSPRDGAQVARLALLVGPEPVHVAATLPSFPAVRAGDTVMVRGRLRPPPDDDGYGEYLRRTGASGSLQASSVEVTARPDGITLQGARDGAGDALQLALPEPEAGLAAGILIGLRERVDRSLAADFATAGASHVVAISGWNIAIVGGLVGAALRGRPRRVVSVSVAGIITAYVIAAGASPSVVRAAVMAAVVLVARETGRAGRAPAALSLAAFLMLLAAPEMVGDAGFRLSVMATAGLLAWATPLGRWIGGLWGGRVPGWLAESLGISLAAQAATLPDVLLTFGRLSLVSPVVNLLVVPLVPAAMAAGLLAMAGGALAMLGLPAGLATLLGLPGWLLLHVIVAVVRVAAGVPFAALPVPAEATLPLALVAAALVLAAPSLVRRRRARRGAGAGARPGSQAEGGPPGAGTAAEGARGAAASGLVPRSAVGRALLGVALVVVAVSTLALGDAAMRSTRLVVLDVGQGDAILVESRDGGRLLVDGGPDPDRLLVELDAQVPPWDRRIDLVVLTHPHEDHVAGLVRVLERYRVGRVFEPGMRGQGPGWRAWDAALADGPPRATLAAGDDLRLGEVRLSVLWPEPGGVPADPGDTGRSINDTSIVLLGEAPGGTFLLTGDAEDDVDPHLVAQGLPHVDVLKVAHHGSATASSDALLAAIRPTLALISVGVGNDYGHPAPSTLGRLRAAGAAVHRTDLEGAMSVELGADGLRLRTSGARRGDVAPMVAARATATGYDSGHDRPGAPRGRPPAALPRPARVGAPARLRGGGHGVVPRARDRGARHAGGRPGGRGRRAPPRRRQARGGPAGRRAPRRRLRGVAGGERPPRAGAARPGPPGDAPGGRRGPRAPRGGAAGGPDRRLRGQARRPAPGADGRAIRLVAPALPRGTRRPGGSARSLAGRGVAGRGTGTERERHDRPPAHRHRLGRRDGRPRGGARAGAGAGDLRAGRRGARRRAPEPLVAPRAPGGRTMTMPVVAYYRGGDGFALDRAVVEVARRLEQETGAAPDRWRVAGAETNAAVIAERVGTAPMFGGGCVAVVTDPGPLLRSKDAREALERALGAVAPGNALVFVEQGDAGTKRAAIYTQLEAAVIKAGGVAREFAAPRAGQLAGWLRNLAKERGIDLEREASEELARRVGAFVQEGDVDRQRQGTLAAGELDKLALYRQAAPITVEDVRALVPELIPDSTWAMLDAVADRRADVAGPLLDRLLETTPLPVVIVQLHRRIRELLVAADLVASGARNPEIVKAVGGHPFRVQKLVEQAHRWSPPELEAALEGILDLDAMIKGAVDAGSTERQVRLAFTLWVRERVAAPRRAPGAPAPRR